MEYNIHFDDVQIHQLVLHKLGSLDQNEGVFPAKQVLNPSEELRDTLQNFFLSAIKKDELFHFYHESDDLMQNEIYAYANYIFNDNKDFYNQSINILKHLYNRSRHAKTQAGDLYVVHFEGFVYNDEQVEALGIFKSETKDRFIKIHTQAAADFAIHCEEGTPLSKVDKGCVILNTGAEEGFQVISTGIKSTEARFWLDDFMKVLQEQDDNYLTKSYLNLCKDFTKKVLSKEEKDEQLGFINKALDYFQTNNDFEANAFKEEVFGENDEWADKFEAYKKDYTNKQGIQDDAFEDFGFSISPDAVKKAKRGFKNIIQLDTQVELKLHSAQVQEDGFLEKGYDDERKMHYYKVYFNEEK